MNQGAPTPQPNARPETGVSFGEILGLLFRRKITVIFCSLASMLAFGFLAFTMNPTFEASSKILIEDNFSTSSPLGQLFALSSSSPAAAEIEILRSRTNISEITGQYTVEGTHTGLGLTQRIDDVSMHWPWERISRRLSNQPDPKGTVQAWMDGPLPPSGIRIEFLEANKVEIALRELFTETKVERDYIEGKPLSFRGNKLYITGTGTQPGRKYFFYSDNFLDTVQEVMSRIKVNETQRGSGILEVRYTDTDPKRAAIVLNKLAEVYIKRNIDRLRRPSTQSREFIEKEKDSVREALEKSEQNLIDFQSQHDTAIILSDAALTMVEKMSELDLELARKELAVKATASAIEGWKAGEIPIEEALINGVYNPVSGAYDPLAMSLISELRNLNEERTTMEFEYQPDWEGFADLDKSIDRVKGKMASKLDTDLKRHQTEERALRDLLDGYQIEMGELPETERKLAAFKREAQALEDIYTLLLGRLQEAAIAEKAAVATVEVIDRAYAPRRPFLPRPLVFSGLGGVIGAVIGIILAFVRESVTKKVLSAAQLETATGLAQMGVIPDFRKGAARSKGGRSKNFLALRDAPESPAAEAYRALRANLSFLGKSRPLKTVTITSAGQGEGKSTTIADLAIALSQTGKKVLLVDADLRRPMLHKFFELPVKGGFTEILREELEWRDTIHSSGIGNMSLITAGRAVANPGDLLASPGMITLMKEFEAEFDYVLFDVPPVLAVADASAFLHELDGIFLLCRTNHLPEGVVSAATKRLSLVGANVMGCILNGYRPSRVAGYGGYGYGYGYGYSYGYGYGGSRYGNRKEEKAS